MEDPKTVGATVRDVVANTPTKTLTGQQIALALRAAYIDFRPLDYGARNLRDFIRKHALDVVERSRAGQDIVYGLRDSSTGLQEPLFESDVVLPTIPQRAPTPLTFLHENRQVWKTFTAPSSPWKLFLDPESFQVRVVSPSEA
jgi:hypothetical protein